MEQTKKLLVTIIMIFLSVVLTREVKALEKSTHSLLNGIVATQTNLDNYLVTNLGFLKGIKEVVNGKEVYKWIQLGGEAEDEPIYLRSFNHYLNPLTNAGYLGLFKSASQWAQEQGTFGSLFGGNYSWPAVRQYYYLGLTSSTKTEREKNLADTFQGLGQLMHLVDDMSVPAHTRNDGHIFYNYEKWVVKPENAGAIINAASNPIFYGGSIQNISSFLDTNQYNGTNPSASNTIGLSEYTQANFFSEDTINASNFPYPKWANTTKDIRDYKSSDGQTRKREYYLKKCCGETNGGSGYLLAAGDFLDYYRETNPDLSIDLSKIPILDDNVYSDYAKLLLPRAVGYSAGLLNYFFRGQINMEKDPNNSSQYVIKNESNEYMSGTFSLYYDDTSDNRRFLTSWGRSINAMDKSEPVTFTEPTDIKEKGKYILVFQGTLGNETGAVVGRVVTLDSGIWEDWEKGLTGKHAWTTKLNFEVVDGFGGNTSKVLKYSSSTATGYGYMYLQTSVERPKKVSFDYYVKSSGVGDFGIGLVVVDDSKRTTNMVFIIPTYTWYIGCSTERSSNWTYKVCYYVVERDKWVHMEQDLLPETENIGSIDFHIKGFEVYIDNIDFKW